jgi:hypothetical protein
MKIDNDKGTERNDNAKSHQQLCLTALLGIKIKKSIGNLVIGANANAHAINHSACLTGKQFFVFN